MNTYTIKFSKTQEYSFIVYAKDEFEAEEIAIKRIETDDFDKTYPLLDITTILQTTKV